MSQNDHPNASAFLRQVSKFIVLIRVRDADDPEPPKPMGTGFIGLHLRDNITGLIRPIVVTAGHLLEHDLRDRTEWTITRLAHGSSPERTARFVTPDPSGNSKVSWYAGKWFTSKHEKASGPVFDLGFLTFRNDAAPGGFLQDDDVLTALSPKNVGLLSGTAVAWAGFPQAASALLGKQILCYYQGVVSTSTLNVEGLPPLYLIDGHNSPGLSGAPVWHCDTPDQKPSIVAVITHYTAINSGFPGLVQACPIAPLLEMLEQQVGAIKQQSPQ